MPVELQAALDSWATFPVRASPRPLVLQSDPVKAPATGFATGSAKEAFARGLFTGSPTTPSGPTDAAGFRLIGAADALDVMRREGTLPGPGPVPPVEPLVITGIVLGSAGFTTDRGTRSLPAWLFSFDGVTDPAAVLAIAPDARYDAPPESQHAPTVGATVGPDDRTVTILHTGAAEGTGPCTADYTVEHAESTTGVAIRIIEHRHDAGQPVACTAVGHSRRETFVLADPLGARVLIYAPTSGPIPTAP